MKNCSSLRIGAFALCGLVGACATTPPLQETKQFQQAFVAVDGAGQPLLDDLAIAERLNGQEIATADAKRVTRGAATTSHQDCHKRWEPLDSTTGYIAGFCLSDAGFYANIGDPPQTRAFRQALALIGQFAQALTSLADGTNAAAATAQVQQLAQNAGDLAASVSLTPAISLAAKSLAAALAPVTGELARAASAGEERRVIIAARTKVGDLILALSNAVPALFDSLTQQTRNQIEHSDAPPAFEAARIESYRVLLADYAELLDRLDDAWNQLVAAARQPSNPANLAMMASISGQITADANTVRRSLAMLRSGAPAN